MTTDGVRVPPRGLPLILFLSFVGAAIAATQPLGAGSSMRLPANADAVLNAWDLNQVCSGLSRPMDILRGNMFFPDPASLLYSEPLLGVGLQSLPLCVLAVNHVALYNASYVLVLAMCALGAWLLAREINGSAPAALVAAAIFAFTTANYDSAARIQIVASQWTPFCLLYLIRFCKGGRRRDAALLGGAFAMQALSCAYYEIFLALLLVLAIPLWIELAGGFRPSLKRIPGAALAVLIASAVVLPLNLAQKRHLDPILAARPQAQEVTLGFFTEVLPSNLLYGGVLGRARVAYDALYFPGVLPVALALLFLFATLRSGKRGGGRTGLTAVMSIGAAAFLFALGTRLATPWGDIPGALSLFSGLVPGLEQARVPSRFLMFSRLALSVAAGAGAQQILNRFPRRPWALASVLALASFAEHWSIPLDTWVAPTRDELPKVYAWLKESDSSSLGPILEYPPSLQRLRREESAWLHLAAFHGRPIANGYSSFRPAWHEFVMEAALAWPDERLLSVLRQVGVRTIVFHPRPRGIPAVDEPADAFLQFAVTHPEQLPLVKSFSDAGRLRGLWSRLGNERVFSIAKAAPVVTPALSPAIDRAGWTCRSSEPGCELAIDDDPATLLRGRAAQGAGQFLRVWLKEPASLEAVSINLGRFPELFPRDPVIRVLESDRWVVVEARLDLERFLSDLTGRSLNPSMSWRFPPMRVSGFEIRLRAGGQGFRELGIPEVHAHAAAGPAISLASPKALPPS